MSETSVTVGVVTWASGIQIAIQPDDGGPIMRFDIPDVFIGSKAVGTRGRRVQITSVADENGEHVTNIERL